MEHADRVQNIITVFERWGYQQSTHEDLETYQTSCRPNRHTTSPLSLKTP